jgi:hypothetical protein
MDHSRQSRRKEISPLWHEGHFYQRVLTFSWCRPVADDLDLRGVHSKVVRANNETQEVRLVHVESALLDFGV